MFLKNTWYVACTANEIDEKPLGRTICHERIAFFRSAQGKAAAVEDFCPHRGAALSLGRVNDGKLVCGYHGLEMGCDGKVVSMPGQRVRGFPANKSRARSLSDYWPKRNNQTCSKATHGVLFQSVTSTASQSAKRFG